VVRHDPLFALGGTAEQTFPIDEFPAALKVDNFHDTVTFSARKPIAFLQAAVRPH
jgi:hypothetical protein